MKFALSLFIFSVIQLSWAQEICDNGIDDDGDGLIDCKDSDCITDAACPAYQGPGACLPVGFYPDIISTNQGFKANGSSANVNLPLVNGTNQVSLIIQGVYQAGVVNAGTFQNDLNHSEERLVWGRVEINLDNRTSSGWVGYIINNHESKRYSWVDQDLGPTTTASYARVGHDFNEISDFEFSFDATPTDLIVNCSQADLSISYYGICYGNFNSESLTPTKGADPSQYPIDFIAGSGAANRTKTIDLLPAPDNPDYIQIRAVGINQNLMGNSGTDVWDFREEGMSIKYLLIDMNALRASGNITVSNGNIDKMSSSFAFSDYDVSSGNSVVTNATILGDEEADLTPQVGIADMTLQIIGDQLVITRSDEYAADFNEIYYVEFLKVSGQPYSSSFFITKNIYSSPEDIGKDSDGVPNDGQSVNGFVDFIIPEGSKRGYLEVSGNGLTSSDLDRFENPAVTDQEKTNSNQMYTFTEVNFDDKTTTGFYVTITTGTQQQLYAWQEVPINPLVDITSTGISGLPPNTDERINFEIVEPNIFRVYMKNDGASYERILNMTFLGSNVNAVAESFSQDTTGGADCDSIYFDLSMCNPGASDLVSPIPISFYLGDPRTDPSATFIQNRTSTLRVNQGKCEKFKIGVSIASLGPVTTADITMVLNDNGSYAGAIGSPIGATFNANDLAKQLNPVAECLYEYNFITSSFKIKCPPTIFPPVNIFTPNGDGKNDIFTFSEKAQEITKFKCTILNRWGNTIFEFTDINQGWDGTDASGSKCSQGVYFYTYSGNGFDGTELNGQGTISLVGEE